MHGVRISAVYCIAVYCRKCIFLFADECGISRISAEKMINGLVAMKPKFIELCENSMLGDGMKEKLILLINERVDVLEKC